MGTLTSIGRTITLVFSILGYNLTDALYEDENDGLEINQEVSFLNLL